MAGLINMCSRSAAINITKKENKTIAAVATTSEPALVMDWENWRIVREILPMKYVELPENDKTVLLDAHSAFSINNVIGSAKNWKIEGNQLIANEIEISETEEKIMKKIEEGHIDSVSIGYQVSKENTVEVPKNSEILIDGVSYKNDYNDDYPLIVRTWWKVKELSLVPIGADEAAKLRRNLIQNQELLNKIEEFKSTLKDELLNRIDQKLSSIKIGDNKMEPKPPDTQDELLKKKRETAEKIREIGKTYFNGKFQDLANQEAMDLLLGAKDITVEEFQARLLNEVQKQGGGLYDKPLSFVGLNEKEQRRYSISRAINNILQGQKSEELEISEQISKQIGKSTQHERSFFIPFEILMKFHPQFQKRAHSVSIPSEGGYFVAEDLRSDLLVESLKNDLVLGRLGATVITGLRDNFTIPKVISGLTAYSVAENTAANKSYLVVGQITASPKHISAGTEYGRQLFYQSSVGIDQLLIKELNDVKNLKADYLALNGTGTNNEPTGLLNATGISGVELSTLNWTNILNVKKNLKKANAFKPTMKWVCSPDVESKLQSTQKATNYPIYLMSEDGNIAGYPSEVTNQVPDQVLAFGDWSELYMLFWGVDELLVDPYTEGHQQMVRLYIFTMMDVLIRQNAAFAIADDVPIS